MIYLIKVEYKNVTLLKVGYAKSIKKRLIQYTTENPLFELLDYREGDRKLEKFLHSMFKEYKFEKGLEWFYYDDYIVNNFHSDFDGSILIEKVKKKMNKFKSFSSKLRLYCKFKEKYPEINFKIDYLQAYIDVLGMDRCKELGYKESLLYEELSNLDYFGNIKSVDNDEKILKLFLHEFYKFGDFVIRMKMYCKFSDKYKDNPFIMEGIQNCIKDPRFLQYYEHYGTKGCSAREYRELELYRGLMDDSKKEALLNEIYNNFKSGDRLAKSVIKSRLKDIYSSLSISKAAKATDLGEYFKMSKTTVLVNGEPRNGFKLWDRLK